MSARRTAVLAVAVALIMFGCRSVERRTAIPGPEWDVGAAEILTWTVDDPAFRQDRALEASGLTTSGRFLYATSEKYWRVLQIDPSGDHTARVMPLDVPIHTELEGVAWSNRQLYLCDEAHAAVYRVTIENETTIGPDKIPARSLDLGELEVAAGKIGIEGVAVTPGGDRMWLLLERAGDPASGCVSRIFPLAIGASGLSLAGEPIVLQLEDCNWRLTGLHLHGDRLLGLKTQFPGERYEIVAIDPDNGSWRVILDMTELLRSVTEDGWHNNVEGITVTADGALWLISDNAWTGIIDDPTPPLADRKTLLIRIPPTR
jgi:hypothetical protein